MLGFLPREDLVSAECKTTHRRGLRALVLEGGEGWYTSRARCIFALTLGCNYILLRGVRRCGCEVPHGEGGAAVGGGVPTSALEKAKHAV